MNPDLPTFKICLDLSTCSVIGAELARHLGSRITYDHSSISPWVDAHGAAERIAAPVSRVRKLTATRAIPHHREHGRVLYNIDELDEWIRSTS